MRIPFTPICVDNFQHHPGVFIYFLSHMHADHTYGLSPSWNYGTIYCTKITAAILLTKFQVNPNLVKILNQEFPNKVSLLNPRGQTSPTSPMIDSSSFSNQKKIKNSNIIQSQQVDVCMTVTLIDANHCPGACMFLLEGYFGRILCTGDFRLDHNYHFSEDSEENPLSASNISKHPIDAVYLDDTFVAPDHDFPTRKVAGSVILKICENYDKKYEEWKENRRKLKKCKRIEQKQSESEVIEKENLEIARDSAKNVQIMIGTDSLGREELLVALAHHLKSLIVVKDPERMQFIQAIINSLKEDNQQQNNCSFASLLPNSDSQDTANTPNAENFKSSLSKTLELENLFTDDPWKGRIFVVGRKNSKIDMARELRAEKDNLPTIAFRASGLKISECATFELSSKNEKTQEKEKVHVLDSNFVERFFGDPGFDVMRTKVFEVPYSLHSSASELEEFVAHVRPRVLMSSSKNDNIFLRNRFRKYISDEKGEVEWLKKIEKSIPPIVALNMGPLVLSNTQENHNSSQFPNFSQNSSQNSFSQNSISQKIQILEKRKRKGSKLVVLKEKEAETEKLSKKRKREENSIIVSSSSDGEIEEIEEIYQKKPRMDQEIQKDITIIEEDEVIEDKNPTIIDDEGCTKEKENSQKEREKQSFFEDNPKKDPTNKRLRIFGAKKPLTPEKGNETKILANISPKNQRPKTTKWAIFDESSSESEDENKESTKNEQDKKKEIKISGKLPSSFEIFDSSSSDD